LRFNQKYMANQDNSLLRKVAVWLPLLLATVLAVGMFIGLRFQATTPTQMSGTDLANLHRGLAGQGKVEELMRYIDAKYVEDADEDAMIKKAIDAVLGELDPHSNYISAEDLVAINEQLEGNFDGIGVEFMILDDTIVVVTPLAGGPSEAAGIRAGDKIVAIEDSIVAGQNLDTRDIFSLLRGEKGTEVEVGIRRHGEPKMLKFSIVRDKIPVHSVDVATMLDEKTGFIKVNRFSATTYDEFVKSLQKLVEEHEMQDLVVDLRHNPGGYLTQATNMLSQLFPEKGKLLVYTEGRTVKRTEYTTNGRPFYNWRGCSLDRREFGFSQRDYGGGYPGSRSWRFGRTPFFRQRPGTGAVSATRWLCTAAYRGALLHPFRALYSKRIH